MVKDAALIVHPTMKDQRTFVDERLEERLRDFYEEDIPVYALRQTGYNDDLVGSQFYNDTFSDSDARGNLDSESLNQLLEYERFYMGGGDATLCVKNAASSLGFYGYSNEKLIVDPESTYSMVQSKLMNLDQMVQDSSIDVMEEVGSLYSWVQIKSAL